MNHKKIDIYHTLYFSAWLNTFFNAQVFQPLGRITYCIYLVHMPLIRVFAGGNRGVVHSSTSLIVRSICCFIQFF